LVYLDLTTGGQTHSTTGTIVWNNLVTVVVDDAHLALDSNGRDLEGQLPSVDPEREISRGNTTPSPTMVYLVYSFSDANQYDWTGGPQPASLAHDHVAWLENSAAMAEAERVSATNGSADNSDNLWTLAVGALLGVAGGAFVGALQELLHVHPRNRGTGNDGDAGVSRQTPLALATPAEARSQDVSGIWD
jgi:hypothetical protein